MPNWPRNPSIFEINTWVWLSSLSKKYGRALSLESIPAVEWDTIAGFSFDSVWLMGVWERSPAGIAIANRNEGLLNDFRTVLPDFGPTDNVGSPYCVRRYVVDQHLGGPGGLARAREELSRRGMRACCSDFVPNHVAPDHPWVIEHPEYFIRGNADDALHDPASFSCRGRGGLLPAAATHTSPRGRMCCNLMRISQGSAKRPGDTVSDIACQCDGVRCDMAMLLLNAIVGRTWGSRAGQPPTTEYWLDLIPAIKAAHPGFLFIAEAYWGLEYELQQKGSL